jgi:hypothetical protein
MEIKPFFPVLIILAVLAVLGLAYRTQEQAPSEQALPEQAPSEQALGTGTLKLYLSDAPMDAENVAGVYINITYWN